MFSVLKNHPFEVAAFFRYSLVITLAVRKEELTSYIPPSLRLDTADDKWGFIAVACVETQELRPKALPKQLGNNFFLIGYRIFVRHTDKFGKTRRGLYILKSQTDSKRMQFLGNIFTHYHYERVNVKRFLTDDSLSIESNYLYADIDLSTVSAELPARSPFTSWKAARKFAGPLPYTFSTLENGDGVLIVEGVRSAWKPQPVGIKSFRSDFLDSMKLEDLRLASAFIVKDVPYYWKKGYVD